MPSELAVAITAGFVSFQHTCVFRVALAARATVVKKSAASVGISAFSSPSVRSPSTAWAFTSHTSTLLSRPVVATKVLSCVFHTTSRMPFECPVHSATGHDVLLRRSHSFSTGVASESSTTSQREKAR